jgi:hypothetical protein
MRKFSTTFAKTHAGVKFTVEQRVQKAADNVYGLESQQWFLINQSTNKFMSPWHELDFGNSQDN